MGRDSSEARCAAREPGPASPGCTLMLPKLDGACGVPGKTPGDENGAYYGMLSTESVDKAVRNDQGMCSLSMQRLWSRIAPVVSLLSDVLGDEAMAEPYESIGKTCAAVRKSDPRSDGVPVLRALDGRTSA